MICIAATNFPQSLDKALIRPGRFDRHVTVPNPDVKGRKEILEVHFKNVPAGKDVDLKVCFCQHNLMRQVYGKVVCTWQAAMTMVLVGGTEPILPSLSLSLSLSLSSSLHVTGCTAFTL